MLFEIDYFARTFAMEYPYIRQDYACIPEFAKSS